jgi:hypothetical protein
LIHSRCAAALSGFFFCPLSEDEVTSVMTALRVDSRMPPEIKVATLIRNLLDPYRYFRWHHLGQLSPALFELLYVPLSDYSLPSHEFVPIVRNTQSRVSPAHQT